MSRTVEELTDEGHDILDVAEEMHKRVQETLAHLFSFGTCDGAHHKQWAIDQCVKILTGCPMVTKTKTNVYTGKEFTFKDLGESEEYKEWVKDYQGGYNEEEECHEYEWDEGIGP